MNLLAIDPGNEKSAYAHCNGRIRADRLANNAMLELLDSGFTDCILAIEMVACYGMAVGAEVFDTCVWIGRFIQAWQPKPFIMVYRSEVKMHLCHNMRAKDANIRQAIIDLYGGKEKAIGRKANPGPLYSIAGDEWSALAIALTAQSRSKITPAVPEER